MRTADFCDCLCNVLSSCQWYKHQNWKPIFWGRGNLYSTWVGRVDRSWGQINVPAWGIFDSSKEGPPKRAIFKTVSALGAHPCYPCDMFRSPVKLEWKKWMTRPPQNSGFGINEETLMGPIKAKKCERRRECWQEWEWRKKIGNSENADNYEEGDIDDHDDDNRDTLTTATCASSS